MEAYMNKFYSFLLIGLFAFYMIACNQSPVNQTPTNPAGDASNDTTTTTVKPSTSTTVYTPPVNNKITKLSDLIEQTSAGGTINLSEYSDITDYNATISKNLTLKGSKTDMIQSNLVVSADGVVLSGISNASVTASSSLKNGGLKIANSSLSRLSINGGGIHSIELADVTVDTVIVDKDMTGDAQYVRLVVDNQVKVGTLQANSDFYLAGETSSDKWQKIEIAENVNIATDETTNISTNNCIDVKIYNSDVSTDVLSVHLIGNKNTELKTDLFSKVFTKKYGDLEYDVNEFIKDINTLKGYKDYSKFDSFSIYLVMSHIYVSLKIEDLPNDIGAVFIYGWLPDVTEDGVLKKGDWKNTPDAAPAKYCQDVINGVCEFKNIYTQISKHMTEKVYDDQGKFLYGGTEEGLQFFIVPMANKDSYANTQKSGWNNGYFTPAVDGATIENYLSWTTDSPAYNHYVIWKEWVSIGGKMKFDDNGNFDQYYDRAINIKFDEEIANNADQNVIKDKKQYVTITINKQTYPEMYYSDYPTNTVESIPCYPSNVGYSDESVDLTIGHRPRKITLYGSDFDNPSRGYDISFSATPN